MPDPLMGVEREYALAGHGANGAGVDKDALMSLIDTLAAEELIHLPAYVSSGMFLANASRFYRDSSNRYAHQEVAICEVDNPRDVVRYLGAAERILLGLAEKIVQKDKKVGSAMYFKHNVDYLTGASWGCHESYMTTTEPAGQHMCRMLTPHLVSRIIYTGVGGFQCGRQGPVFMVSPRVAHITKEASLDTEHDRPIFNQRDESLMRGQEYRRLHVICGESLCTNVGIYLRSATTAMIVAMIDAGLDVGGAVQLENPVEAMRTFSFDPTCTKPVAGRGGTELTASAIQRHYLELATANLDKKFMPSWARDACGHWRRILDLIDAGAPDSVANVLDWAIKLSLYQAHVRRRGFEWDALPYWNRVLETAGAGPARREPIPDRFLGGRLESIRAGAPEALREGLTAEKLPAFGRLWQELIEMDYRYSGIGPEGTFSILDAQGAIDHRIPGCDNIEHAVEHPPAVGRAHLRGELVRRLASRKESVRCEWEGVWNTEDNTYVDLSDPYATEERWVPAERSARRSAGRRDRSLSDLMLEMEAHRSLSELNDVLKYYAQGNFGRAKRALIEFEGRLEGVPEYNRRAYYRYKAWIRTRTGFADGAELLRKCYPSRSDSPGRFASLSRVNDYLLVYRFRGLKPAGRMRHWIRQGQQMIDRRTGEVHHRPVYLEHVGNFYLSQGKFDQAAESLESALQIHRDHEDRFSSRLLARTLCSLAELRRLQDRRDEAHTALDEAELAQNRRELLGDRLSFAVLARGRLMLQSAGEGDRMDGAHDLLRDAERGLRRHEDTVGVVRAILLQARLCRNDERAAALRGRAQLFARQAPTVLTCPLYKRVLRRWHTWVHDPRREHNDIAWHV